MKNIMDLVTTRLQDFETRVDERIQEWTASTMKGCRELEDIVEGVQQQLGEIQERQVGFQATLDTILQRLEVVENPRMCSIPEGSFSPPGQYTADSVRSLPQPARQSFAATREEWEKRGGTSEKDFSISRTVTVLQDPSRVTVEDQDTAQKGKRSPSSGTRSPRVSVHPQTFASFTLGGMSGIGGTSGGGGPPGGPSGGGGGGPGDGNPRGQVPRYGDPVPAARPQSVGALRLEAPARYAGGAKPGVRAWLREVSRWMRLMDYPQAKWIDIVATRTEGAAASWLSHEQIAMERGTRAPWAGWADFSQEMIRAFEPTTDDTLA